MIENEIGSEAAMEMANETAIPSGNGGRVENITATDEGDAGEVETSDLRRSALQDNIARKGKNAYYFAHAHKANGPAWDGKAEPKLLSRTHSHDGHKVKASAFEYYKSNITTYAFIDDGAKVKLYIELPGVGEKCCDDDVELDYSETSFSLTVHNFKSEIQRLSFGKLTAPITTASFRVKADKIILTLTKADANVVWHTINDKGAPDHEMV